MYLYDLGAIPLMIQTMNVALGEPNRRYFGFNLIELANCLASMAANDANKANVCSYVIV